jgi:thioredoxin 1
MSLLAGLLIASQPGCDFSPIADTRGVSAIAFTAEWCGPCREQRPTVQAARDAGHDVVVADIDQNPQLARDHNVRTVPTYLIFRDGREVFRTGSAAKMKAFLDR